MSSGTDQRKLAAIVFTDMASYSALRSIWLQAQTDRSEWH